jgi:hypothetical protein
MLNLLIIILFKAKMLIGTIYIIFGFIAEFFNFKNNFFSNICMITFLKKSKPYNFYLIKKKNYSTNVIIFKPTTKRDFHPTNKNLHKINDNKYIMTDINLSHSEYTKLNNIINKNYYVGQDFNEKKIYAVTCDIRILELEKKSDFDFYLNSLNDNYKQKNISKNENETCLNIDHITNLELKNKGYDISINKKLGFETKEELIKRIENVKQTVKDD